MPRLPCSSGPSVLASSPAHGAAVRCIMPQGGGQVSGSCAKLWEILTRDSPPVIGPSYTYLDVIRQATFNEQSIQPEWDGAINYTYVITPTVVNSFIGSALWYSAYFGPANVAASQKLFPTAFFFNDGGANGGGFYQMG